MTNRCDEWREFLVTKLGTTNWIVAPRLTDRMRRKGYELAVTQRKFQQLKTEFESMKPRKET